MHIVSFLLHNLEGALITGIFFFHFNKNVSYSFKCSCHKTNAHLCINSSALPVSAVVFSKKTKKTIEDLMLSIHHLYRLSLLGSWECWSLSQLTSNEMRGENSGLAASQLYILILIHLNVSARDPKQNDCVGVVQANLVASLLEE